MNRDIGQEILDGITEIKQWQQGDRDLRTTELNLPSAADVAPIRKRMGLSQPAFAALLGVSVGTLRNWEHGRREPQGPAKALLRVAEVEPDALRHALAGD
jgi:putative transcriptional regulator